MSIIEIAGIGIALILAITLHEAAHGMAAFAFGDKTAYRLGRVTLNPIAHIDLFGTILLPGFLLLVGANFLFGSAKPVPVNFDNLSHKRIGTFFVALAGPFTNFLIAIVSCLLLHINPRHSTLANDILLNSVRINIMLAIFNMIPLIPLDGGRVLSAFLPDKLNDIFESAGKYTMLIFIFIILFSSLSPRIFGIHIDILGSILYPPFVATLKFLLTITGH